ncbi:hypothetical protein [Archaeoglobus profundus]|uniref:Uncharacterized protein n=1 Tax=Archaeoglobus profundus (strain DSM 5631 / JCM 9629 / NBRC 100127 / Av18) TaxID=572546 RepID=D2RGW8_ARCPA|nr:hypothetical protein [Archaeoglobus profundus]ADB57543.1 hypothetical protein Arcpr_0477 [Archaeoglobus profundus DSM 5631]
MKEIELTLDEFEKWLRERGYDKRMGKENFELFLKIGLAGLFFMNSSLLMGYIFSSLGLPSERISEKTRFEIGRRIKEIKATRDYLKIVIE